MTTVTLHPPRPARRLASALCGALLALAAAGAQAQQASSIVIQGKDNWLFPGCCLLYTSDAADE